MNPICKICNCKISVLDIENQDAYKAKRPSNNRLAWMHRHCYIVENEEQIFKEKYENEKL